MTRAALLILFSFLLCNAFARHIIGGEMRYKYLGPGTAPNTNKYKISLVLFKGDDNSGAQLLSQYQVGVFNGATYAKIQGLAPPNKNWWIFAETEERPVPISKGPCVTGEPDLRYTYRIYTMEIELKLNSSGYFICYQTCCRQNGLANISEENAGASYYCFIPGSLNGIDGVDNSPVFNEGIEVICANSKFSYNFGAVDPDGDDMEYKFLFACNGGSADQSDYKNPGPPLPPEYKPLTFSPPFDVQHPLGPNVTINSATGEISGIAPDEGIYVLPVWITVSRSGKYVTTHRKDLIIKVSSCQTPTARIGPLPDVLCDSFNVAFTNGGYNPPGTAFRWDFGDPASGANNTSTLENPEHFYNAAGDYTVQLITDVNNGECGDTATKKIKVYPGFYPAFKITGKCAFNDIRFFDKTVALYGNVNSWLWDFGDFSDRVNNTSQLKNPTHTYSNPGVFPVHLTVKSDIGCIASKDTLITLLDKPALAVTNDTLICSIDTLQLSAAGDGSITWSPAYMISSLTSPTPLVSPDVTTTYHVQLTDSDGCTGYDSVKVSVVDFVTLSTRGDTTICQADPIALSISSDALYYTWTASPADPSLTDPAAKIPVVKAQVSTSYSVRASISDKCFADAVIHIKSVPYPKPAVGPDIAVCFGNSTQLHASGGAFYAWTPAIFLNDTHIPDPKVISPASGVTYVVAVRDTLGCPKTVRDTVLVKVIRIKADAGPADTSVVLYQPLQLHATGGTHYSWLPVTGLSDPLSPNPIALPQDNTRYTVTVTDDNGCKGVDDIYVKLYKTGAGLYIPNAFTPDRDGVNDYFQPTGLGMASLAFFRVYNRLGQLIFATSSMKQGWDGSYKGRPQETGTYVWIAEGTDYTGKKVQRQGTVVLIR